MALTVNHPTLKETTVFCHTASSTGTPIAAVARCPFRGKIVKVGGVVEAAFTTDMSVAVALISAPAAGAAPGAGTAITGSPFTITAANSAAGTQGSMIPTGANNCNEDDVILFTPSGSTGTNIPATFYAVIQVA